MTAPPRALTDLDGLKSSVSIASIIGETLPLKRNGRLLASRCPFHGERTPSFYVYDDGYHCFGCGAHGDVFDWLMATRRMTLPNAVTYLSGAPSQARPVQLRPIPALSARSATADVFLRCWDQGVDPAGTIVETYLRNRGGLSVPDRSPIRFHPRCQRGPRDLVGGPEYWPAMLALMTDPATGEPVGVHRTYLLHDGSAKAPTVTRPTTVGGEVTLAPKRILGTWGVIRLAEPTGEGLGLAEGIETALSAMQVIGWGPVWAAGSRGGISSFPVLAGHSLTIFADGDAPGVTAARECAARWAAAGSEALIHIPPSGEDWNDAARRIAA